MRTRLFVLAVALSLLLPLALAGPGKSQPPTLTPGDRDGEDDDDRGASDDRRPEESREHGKAAIGSFALSASQQAVDGDYVDFSYNDTSVTAFTVDGQLLFDLSVAGTSDHDEDEHGVVARGAQLKLETPSYSLQVHDNPAAVVKLETDGVATLLFASGATLTQLDHERVTFTVGNLTGALRGEGVRVAGPSVLADHQLLLLVNQPVGGFDMHRGDIGEAVAKKHVGAEASFNHKDGGVEEDVVSYGNVTMHAVKAEKGNLTLLIDGHGFDGRVVVLNVDGRVVGASKADDLSVLFDNATIAHASSIQDVLDPDDDGLQAEYYVVFDPATESFQLLVSVPHYSVHTLSVTTLLQAPPPSVIVGVLAGVLILAASGVVLFRRPKA